MSGGDAPGVPAVILGPESRRLRRALGPTAWAALEELVTEAVVDGGSLSAHTNVRELAGRLGVGFDAAASALRRLKRSGLVEREVQPVDRRGRFASGRYLLKVPAGVIVAPYRAQPDTAQSDTGPVQPAGGQAPLFDLDGSTPSSNPNSRHHSTEPINAEPTSPLI